MNIKDKFESISSFLLDGLQVINLHVVEDEIERKLLEGYTINDQIYDGAVIYCDLHSNEFIVKTSISIMMSYKEIKANFFAKYSVNLSFRDMVHDLMVRSFDILAEDMKNSEKLNCLIKTCMIENRRGTEHFETSLDELLSSNTFLLNSRYLSRDSAGTVRI